MTAKRKYGDMEALENVRTLNLKKRRYGDQKYYELYRYTYALFPFLTNTLTAVHLPSGATKLYLL